MDPRRRPAIGSARRLPRTRGDGPLTQAGSSCISKASPHTRGWTRETRRPDVSLEGFPAHAGMDPSRICPSPTPPRLPRTRGDGPGRGSTRRRRRQASPHTRGWTRDRPGRAGRPRGFPAHAGMDPRGVVSRTSTPGFPAHAGMDPRAGRDSSTRSWLPRTRGDGPMSVIEPTNTSRASPHTRGWTRLVFRLRARPGGFPAHAGMDPARSSSATAPSRLPRTRGDGPHGSHHVADQTTASPHTRGWTRAAGHVTPGDRGFPAHAGMDPRSRTRPDAPGWLPRTRGDGPARVIGARLGDLASPHTRGWTP